MGSRSGELDQTNVGQWKREIVRERSVEHIRVGEGEES